MNLLEAFGVSVTFKSYGFEVQAVKNVDFVLPQGQVVGIVGESGSGKSTFARVLSGIQEPTAGHVTYMGKPIQEGKEIYKGELRKAVQMVFQDPYSSLNPRHTVGKIISAPFEIQGVKPEGGVKKAVQELMERVGLNPEHYNRYPNEFSGGQRQRIGVARAIALKPKLIVADEPVSALDVSIQAQVVNLLDDLQEEFGLSYLFVAHDLSVVQHISDRVVVMYLGKVMESAPTESLFTKPRHPYTKALLSAVPIPDPKLERTRERILLQGDLPSPVNPPAGCVFNTRCWKAQDKCRTVVPEPVTIAPNHILACHFPE